MINATALTHSTARSIFTRATSSAMTGAAFMALGVLVLGLSSGCQSPGLKDGFRLSDAFKLPGATGSETNQASQAMQVAPPQTQPAAPPQGYQTAPPQGYQAAPPQAYQAAPPQAYQAAPPQAYQAVPSQANAAAQLNLSGMTGAPVATGMSNGSPVSQVGFVDHLRTKAGGCGACGSQCGGCGTCNSCLSCNSCRSCAPCGPGVTNPAIGFVCVPDPNEFICNGGDLPPEARVMKNDNVAGVGPQDAIVHYTTQAGDILVQPSSRVCLYSPRFGAVRQVSGAVAGEKAIGPRGTYRPVGPNNLDMNLPSLVVLDTDELAQTDVARRVDAMRDRNRGVPVEGILQPMLAEDVWQILAVVDVLQPQYLTGDQLLLVERGAVAAQQWTIRDAVEVMIQSVQPPVLIRDQKVEALVVYEFPDAGRLQIIKVADRGHAQQGEEVAFAIRVQNVGDSAVTDVEIVDNLIPRLEYVDGSQKCDRDADFQALANDVGSVRMKWSLKEPLEVGETALIEFKAKVR